MNKRIVSALLTIITAASLVTGCGSAKDTAASDTATATDTAAAMDTAAEADTAASSDTEAATNTAEASDTLASAEDVQESQPDDATVRVGSLKGPTTIGLVNLMKASDDGTSEGNYSFTMESQPDAITSGIVGGKYDIALVPANLASVLYNKTKGGITVIDINTLGVLDCITGDTAVKSVADLAGRTVITTGQGATPEYALNYLLAQNGITDCTIEFKSEATEIAAMLDEDPNLVAVLPQPFATAAMIKNDKLSRAFSLTDEWKKVSDDSALLTGVTVVTNDFLEKHKGDVDLFIKEQNESCALAADDTDTTAALTVQYGIIEKEPVAKKALPYCNIVCITGDTMKTQLSGYLKTLYDQNPKAVGGKLPEAAFYYAD